MPDLHWKFEEVRPRVYLECINRDTLILSRGDKNFFLIFRKLPLAIFDTLRVSFVRIRIRDTLSSKYGNGSSEKSGTPLRINFSIEDRWLIFNSMKGIYVFNLRKNNISREDIQRFSQRLRKLSFSLKQMQDDLNEIYACTMNEYFSRFTFFFLFRVFSSISNYILRNLILCNWCIVVQYNARVVILWNILNISRNSCKFKNILCIDSSYV